MDFSMSNEAFLKVLLVVLPRTKLVSRLVTKPVTG